jgi:molybdate transport system substrate-binding protein
MMKGIAIVLGLVMTTMTPVKASELKLIAGGSLAGLFKQLGPQFENASGHTLSIHFDSMPNIISRINAGTPFDAVVVPADVFKDARRRAEAGPVDTGCLQEGAARGLFGRVRSGQRRRRLHCQGL